MRWECYHGASKGVVGGHDGEEPTNTRSEKPNMDRARTWQAVILVRKKQRKDMSMLG